ncbi:MAG: polysaccharide deacetylase family protein [Myxococcota bacterium]
MAMKYLWAGALVATGGMLAACNAGTDGNGAFNTDGLPTAGGDATDGNTDGVDPDGTAGDTDGGGTNPGDTSVDPEPMECGTDADAGGFTFERVSTWLGDSTAAYSMIHDDMCGPALAGIHELAVPALNERGLPAALGPFIDACDEHSLWGEVQAAQAAGHEIANHSYSHAEVIPENAQYEIGDAKAAFDANLDDPVSFFVFPFDFFTADTIAVVGSTGHIGARAGNRDDNDAFTNPPLNSSAPQADLEIEFDVWPRTFSKYSMYPDNDILAVHVHEAIEDGAWAVREFHSVSASENPPQDGSEGFGPVPISVYEDHLDFLVEGWHSGEVWTGNPSDIIRYRHARGTCVASLSGSTLEWDTSNAECQEFMTPLTVVVTTGNDVDSVEALQGGQPMPTRKLGANTYAVTSDPSAGAVELAGCSDAGLELSGGLPPKPTPAESVCDLTLVVGSGSPGCMDDFERPPEEFQVLPNPSQCDGRDGSWSWYPQTADVEMVDDGGNTVLRYAGNGLGAWTGATLAFLGGNGAGTCYDASAYTGLRFRIRGQITGGDPAGGMIVSFVTAETQTQVFGGDLEGEGGHFHSIVTPSAAWTTVEIPFSSLNTPAWGDSAGFTEFADGKLQVIDFGISNTATSFELFFDDIELY